ncbi:MAG: glycosyltransferase 61 family protein [Paracoccaceae bacterium]
MPIFRNAAGIRIFYAHVPKTGGTYIEDLFRHNGFERYFWDGRPGDRGLTISPQHFHRAIYEQFVDFGSFDWRFMTVRHPLDRLISEFRSTHGKSHQFSFPEWLADAEQNLAGRPHYLDNHLRPQIDFYHPSLEIHRSEEQFDHVWAKGLTGRLGVEFAQPEVARRRNTKETKPIALSDSELKQAVAFCEHHYAGDFTFFDYTMEDAETLKRYGRVPARTERPLPVSEHQNALIAPIRIRPDLPNNRHTRNSGVYRPDGTIVFSSIWHRHGGKFFNEAAFEEEQHTKGRAIYAGPLFAHYGHFLIESLARLWYLHENPDPEAKIVWSVGETPNPEFGSEALTPLQRRILDMLGLKNEVILVNRATRFDSVVVPGPGFEITDFFHPTQARFLESAGIAYEPEPGLKVWLSRSRLPGAGDKERTKKLEARLAGAGWTIVWPEEMPIDEQMDLLSRCERIAGEEGSAFHTLLLLRNLNGLRVDIAARARAIKPTYWEIARIKGFEQHEHAVVKPTRRMDRLRAKLRPVTSLDLIVKALT